jgi:hypothetical protein
LREILQIVDRYVSTIASVARGDVKPGAVMLEQGLASAVPVAIGFLANQVGLSDVPEKVVKIIQDFRVLVDKALDWLFDQAWRLGQAALRALGLGGPAPEAAESANAPDPHTFEVEGQDHRLYANPAGVLMVASNGPTTVSGLEALKDAYARYVALPPTATKGVKNAILDEMITLIKNDPTLIAQLAGEKLGDAPNLGEVGAFGSQSARFRPAPKEPHYAPLWELEAEHVIPRQFLGSFFDAVRPLLASQGISGMPEISDDEYDELITVLIYLGAAHLKTRGNSGDLARIRALGERYGRWAIRMRAGRKAGDPVMAGEEDATRFLRQLGVIFRGVLPRTEAAVKTEWATNAPARGWVAGDAAGDAKRDWLVDRVKEAYDRQLPQMVGLLDERLSDISGD